MVQGYDMITDFDGKAIAVQRATGECSEAVTVLMPAGSIWYTPEQQQDYKERKKAAQQRELEKEMRKQWRKNTPAFCFVSVEEQEQGIRPATMARLVYLATYLGYAGVLKRSERRFMKFSDLGDVLYLKKSEVHSFWKEVKDKYVFLNEHGYLCMHDSFARRGKITYGGRYQQIYNSAVQALYKSTGSMRHKYLGYVFQMLPFVNVEYNILCKNPMETNLDCIEQLSIDEFCIEIGYSPANRARLMKAYSSITFPVNGKQEQFCVFITKSADIGSTKIIINPHILYHGKMDLETQILGVLCDFSV